MPPTECFLSLYYNGHVERRDTEGVVFACSDTMLLKVKTNVKLDVLIQQIQSKVQPKRVVELTYRYPTTLAQGRVWYESLNIVGDGDIQLMFDMFKTSKRLGVATVEVYAKLVDGPIEGTQVEQSYYEPYHDSTIPSSYPFDETQPHYHSIPSSSTHHPTPSNRGIDLNTPLGQDNLDNHVPTSILAGVHNEEVGDFSENEDDLLERHVADDDEDRQPEALHYSDPPLHFRNVASNDIGDFDDEFVHSISRNKSYLVANTDNLQEGVEFPSKEMAQLCIQEYHLKKSLDFTVEHSNTTRWIVRCVHDNCVWRCRVHLGKKSQVWKITKLDGPHTCVSTMLSQDHRQLSSAFICESILQLVKEDPTISVSVLIAHIRERYTYTTTYRKAWLAKQKAVERIYGNWEESYKELPKWALAFQHYLPGTICDFETLPFVEDGQVIPGKSIFHRFFWSFQPCIKGFRYCKPVVSVDGTWLYGKYRGTLLIAIAQDGRNNTIPIAYALVEGETSDAWLFFLRRLRYWVAPQPDLCLISDRHEAIKSAVRRLNSNWVHVFCIRHISQNFMRTFKNADMRRTVTNMGYSMTQPSATYYRSQINDWNEDAARWVDDIPKEQWLQAWDGGRRWGHMTTNLAECINKVLRGTRNLPVSSVVQATYHRLTEVFVKRGSQAQAMMASGMVYTDLVMENIEKQRTISNSHEVRIHNRERSIFRVKELVRPPSGRPTGTFVVDLEKQWCDCGEFQALHYPCSHVIAACSHISHDHMMYVPPQYTMQYVFNTYLEEFQAIPLQSYWPEYTGTELCHNPDMRRALKGRPKSTRIRTEMDQREKSRHPKRCGLCRNEGHSKNQCPNRTRLQQN